MAWNRDGDAVQARIVALIVEDQTLPSVIALRPEFSISFSKRKRRSTARRSGCRQVHDTVPELVVKAAGADFEAAARSVCTLTGSHSRTAEALWTLTQLCTSLISMPQTHTAGHWLRTFAMAMRLLSLEVARRLPPAQPDVLKR